MALVSIDNLTYQYPDVDVPALREVSLQVEAGEWIVLQGVTGSGKSTLLKCLTGACPDFYGGTISGKVAIAGRTVAEMTPGERVRTIGFVGQDPEAGAVYDRVSREIAFSLENLGVPKTDMAWRVAEALELVGMSHAASMSIHELSGGQRQRIALAAALVHQPQVLLLDEPTSQLDPLASHDLFDRLGRLQREFGVTIVMSEHRLDGVYPRADRVIVLEDGIVQHIDNPRGTAKWLRSHQPEQTPTLARLFPNLPQPQLTVREVRRTLERQWDAQPQSSQNRLCCTEMAQSGRVEAEDGHPEMAQSGSVQVIDVTSCYPGQAVPALDGCRLSLQDRAVTAVVGANGSGKSTLLRVLAGLQPIEHGRVEWGGLNQIDVSEQMAGRQSTKRTERRGWFGKWVGRRAATGAGDRRDAKATPARPEVAYLPQKPSELFSQLTVEEELRYGLQLRRVETAEIERRISDVTALFSLAGMSGRAPRDLSGGEQVRVALASLWVTKPRVLLLDEPTRGLDAAQKRQLGATLMALKQHQHALIVLVTHDMEFVAEFADRVAFVHQGKVAMVGAPDQVFSQALVFAPAVARAFRPFDKNILSLKDAMRAGWAQ